MLNEVASCWMNCSLSSDFVLPIHLCAFVTAVNLYVVTVLNHLQDMRYHKLIHHKVKVSVLISRAFATAELSYDDEKFAS